MTGILPAAPAVEDSGGDVPSGVEAPTRRHHHRRVVRKGTELFDADGVKQEPGDMRSDAERARDDDERILSELPPHWGVYSERSESGA